MSHGVEFEGNNVENAVDNACAELSIPREKLKYDVISYGSSGIFGLVGTKKARIRVIAAAPAVTETDPDEEHEDSKQSIPPEPIAKTTEPAPAEEPETEPLDDDRFSKNPIELGKQILQRIIDGITTEATISHEEDSERISYKINGGNAAILIGKRGQTLESIQYIIEKVVNKHSEKRLRVQVDVEGYLEMRRDSLKRLAERLAEKSKRTGKPVTIGQMNAHDRRIVHLALKEDHAVRTKSVGDGFLRKLVIFPKKNISHSDSSS